MRTHNVLRWVARVWGVASALLLTAFAFGGLESLRFTSREFVGFLFFPVGVVVGFAVAWRNDLIGGLITVGSLALFYVWMFASSGRVPTTPYFLLFAGPGFLHLAVAWLARRTGHKVVKA